MDRSGNIRAFSKGTPTLFVLDTPFQLLCAMEFIVEFTIEDYLIIAQLDRSEKRNEQVICMLEEQGLKYEVNWVEDYWEMVNSFLENENNVVGVWDRVVIGNYNALDQWVTASRFANRDAIIVFTDDGSSSIELLKSGQGLNPEYEQQFSDRWQIRNIDCAPYIFTIYADIPTRRFVSYCNSFSNLMALKAESIEPSKEVIYVIGTNSVPYSCVMGINIKVYEDILWKKLKTVRKRFPREDIIYIPHGRDSNELIKSLCERLSIVYYPLDCAVEYFFVKSRAKAKSFFGFGSTALLTLKKLMPDADVTNWLIDNPDGECYVEYMHVAKYYQEHGVELDKITLPFSIRFRKRKRQIKNKLKSLNGCC